VPEAAFALMRGLLRTLCPSLVSHSMQRETEQRERGIHWQKMFGKFDVKPFDSEFQRHYQESVYLSIFFLAHFYFTGFTHPLLPEF